MKNLFIPVIGAGLAIMSMAPLDCIMIQPEALGLDQTNGNIFITSEKAFAPIYVVEPLSPN